MIIVCEPQCKGISHEKVNCGFIYGLLLAYPKEKILFFAEESHFKEVESLFKDNAISTKYLKHISINFNANKSFSFTGIIQYYILFKKIFNKTLFYRQQKILLLSSNPIIIYVIKKLKQQNKYKKLCFTFVLHGELEDIVNKNYKKPYVPTVEKKLDPLSFGEIIIKLIKNSNKIPTLFLENISQPFIKLFSVYSLIFKNIFRTKNMMMWRHSNQYNYISMSPHVTENAKKYIDTDYLNFHTIILPIVFAKPSFITNNEYIKFAVFGYGDSAQMKKMLTILSNKKIKKPYEIRVISMDSRGTDGFKNISRLSNGNILTRKEMEEALPDIDVFINLYDKTRHKFGCSLSILESFSYLKPVLHLSNPGYNYFNKPRRPIGFRAENINEFVNIMCDMIENYHLYKNKLRIFRRNMLEYRLKYAIENNLDKLRYSLTFKSNL